MHVAVRQGACACAGLPRQIMRSFVASEGHPPLIMLVTCTMHAATGGDSTRGISRVAAPAAAPRPYGHASGLPPVSTTPFL